MRKIIVDDIHCIIELGLFGENKAREVVFPFAAEWERTYGTGEFQLVNKRHCDADPYPCVISREGNNIIWVVKSADVNQIGRGSCQLTYIVNDVIAKSVIFSTLVLPSIEESGEVPEPYEDWVNNVLQAGAEAHESADRAESAKGTAEIAKNAAEEFANQARIQADHAQGIMGLAVFQMDTEDGNLYVTYPTPYYGAMFSINDNGFLEVITNG